MTRLLTLAIIAASMAACSIEPSEPARGMAATITVMPGVHTLVVGDTITYRAAAIDKFGDVLPNRFWEWGSTNASVVRVNAFGVATAIAAGSATIVASADDRMGVAHITVSKRPQ
jgi:uncharacterized protein YjdB